MRDIPNFCVIVGANGVGKTTIFRVFDFLKNAMESNVNAALNKLGGSRGFEEVRSRGVNGPIEIELKFRESQKSPLVTYFLSIEASSGRAYVAKETLMYRRGSKGKPWQFLNFAKGSGEAVTNELSENSRLQEKDLKRSRQTLKSDDILAIKGLAQFEDFPAIKALGTLIENWHISDFHISRARPEQEAGYAEHLSREGENLSLVIEYLYNHHRQTFEKILKDLSLRIPGVSDIQSKTTEEGRVLLKFKDGAFEDPFLAKYVSDGTIKMLAYLVLLNDPAPHPLLCVEEPENQLYPMLLEELAEEFRAYAARGSQVMVSTHSPDFLNAVNLNELFILSKKDGYTEIARAQNAEQLKTYFNAGEKLGTLWKRNLLETPSRR